MPNWIAWPRRVSSAPGPKGCEACLAWRKGDRHLVVDRHVVGEIGEGHLRRTERDVVGAAKQFIENRTDLRARQHRAQTVVRPSAAERDVLVLRAADVERERVAEDLFVAIGRAEHRHHAGALRSEERRVGKSCRARRETWKDRAK